MLRLIKLFVLGIATFSIHAAGTWSVSTFQSTGGAAPYGFGVPGGTNVTSFSNPYGIIAGLPGLFVADTDNQVLKFLNDPMFAETAIAGDGTANNANGVGVLARFNGPSGLAIRPTIFDLFVADSINQSIRRVITPFSLDEMTMTPTIDPAWNVTSPLAVLGYAPQNVIFDAAGAKLYTSSDDGKVRKYNAGGWGAAEDTFDVGTPGGIVSGMTFDAAGDLYVTADNGVYKLNAATLSGGIGGVAALIAGNAGAAGTSDGAGLTARFDSPLGIAYDALTGNLYVADTNNNTIRQLASDGMGGWTVSTIAGTAGVTGSTDGAAATFLAPTGITFGGPGTIFVTDAGDGGGTHNGLVRMLNFVPSLPPGAAPIAISLQDISVSSPPSFAHVTSATGENVGRATESSFEVGGETGDQVGEVREGDVEGFHMSPQRLKMDIRALNGGALVNYDKGYGDYGSMLKALESSLGTTKAMANVGNGMSFWASGVYAQGRNKVLFGNPAGADKHYGIMVGSHYYHKPTRQLIGMAFDVGLGDSRANIDHKLKSSYRSAEATAYYSCGIIKGWKVNLQAAHMLIKANNHRPYGNNVGIAISRPKSSVTSGLLETDYKFKSTKSFHFKPSLGLRVSHTKQNAFQEKNAGTNNMRFHKASMTEIGAKTGVKFSFFYKKDETTTYALYPEVNFTRYLKAGKMKQKAGLVNSGTVQLLESGTPGKNLLSLGLGAGISNIEDGTKYQVGYTANFQKYRKSQELMLKGSWQF